MDKGSVCSRSGWRGVASFGHRQVGRRPRLWQGAQTAVVAGDPTKYGPYVMRIKLPANTMIPAHTHDKAENVTVISGTMGLGMGKQADKSVGQQLPTGSFFRVPANTPHFAWTESDTIVQVNGMGPATMKMVEPATGSSTAK
jgi:quercetin dioxygenase-like cupin family protein